VKAAISKFLIIIYLFSATELNQLLKLPVLFSHFIEHQKQDPLISFGEFLYHHYAVDHDDDGDAATTFQIARPLLFVCISNKYFPYNSAHTIKNHHH
jgi:hypothetical protein